MTRAEETAIRNRFQKRMWDMDVKTNLDSFHLFNVSEVIQTRIQYLEEHEDCLTPSVMTHLR